MDNNGSMIVQIAAAAMADDGSNCTYYLVPYGLNLQDKSQVAHWWVWDSFLNIRLAQPFVQEISEGGCEVFHDKDCVIEVRAFNGRGKEVLNGSPNEVDIVEKTVDELGRLHQRVNIRGEAYLPIPHDFPHWHEVAGDVHSKRSYEHLWSRNIGDVFFNFFGFQI